MPERQGSVWYSAPICLSFAHLISLRCQPLLTQEQAERLHGRHLPSSSKPVQLFIPFHVRDARWLMPDLHTTTLQHVQGLFWEKLKWRFLLLAAFLHRCSNGVSRSEKHAPSRNLDLDEGCVVSQDGMGDIFAARRSAQASADDSHIAHLEDPRTPLRPSK